MLRAVTSGFLPGDDWADEFEAMTLGGEMYFRTLVEYLTCFVGRFAVPVTAFGPPGTTWSRDRTLLCRALGLPEAAQPGDRARFVTEDLIGSVDGIVYFANAHTIGIRTQDNQKGKRSCERSPRDFSSRWTAWWSHRRSGPARTSTTRLARLSEA